MKTDKEVNKIVNRVLGRARRRFKASSDVYERIRYGGSIDILNELKQEFNKS